jgi:GMP synthase-like glutamine amidotransferase
MNLRVLVLQHEPDDGPGYLGDALTRRGAAMDVVRLDQGESIPDVSGYDMLLVMGGEMNVHQESVHPWLADETRAIRRAVEADKAVLGVCLGGQLLAKALGAQVHLGVAPEIGLTPIALTEAGLADPLFAGLSALEAVEWHDDTFDIPAGAVALARSAGCANQAFRFGRRAYGLQFHPEVTPVMLVAWINANAGAAAVDSPAFQAEVEAKAQALQAQADRLVDNFLRQQVPVNAAPAMSGEAGSGAIAL